MIKFIATWIPKSEVMLNKCFFVVEEITKWIGDGSPVDIIYLDFLKDFEKVSHQILLTYLLTYVIHLMWRHDDFLPVVSVLHCRY